jgi:ABC-type Na+ transport system ATPase subunit NatA
MLELQNLSKSFRGISAVENVSFKVAPGEVVGFLGPNGAGKSTTVKIITGMLRSNDGRVLFEGWDIREGMVAFRAAFGYVPEEAYLYSYLSGLEYLQLVGRLRGLGEALIEAKATRLLKLLHLDSWQYSPISSYSRGMRQRVLIAAALLHDPKLLIFDESLSGLDVVGLEIGKLGGKCLRVRANGSKRSQRIGGRGLCQLGGCVLVRDRGLGAGVKRGIAARRIVLSLHVGVRVALLRIDERAVVESVYERRHVAVGIARCLQAGPLRPIGTIPCGEVLWHLRHLVGEVVHGDDLVAGGDGGRIKLRRLLDLLEGVGRLHRVIDNAAAELRMCRGREQCGKESKERSEFALHKDLLFE